MLRLRVAGNPQAPPEILKTLAGDSDKEVRKSVAYNPNTPPEILKTLAGDSDTEVRNAAKLRLKKIKSKKNESRLRKLIRLMI